MIEKAIFTNLCMIYDHDDHVLVQDRVAKNWPGVTFPGGHVEVNESFHDALIREVYEETGLTITNPHLCGIKHFLTAEDVHYIVLLYKSDQFSGTLQGSDEGDVFWIPRADLSKYHLAEDMLLMMPIFENEELSEFFYEKDKADWNTKIF